MRKEKKWTESEKNSQKGLLEAGSENGKREQETGAAQEGIVFHQVSVQFHERLILDALTLTIHPRERLALMGPSGAGKSTLLKLIAGLVQPTQGRVVCSGSVSMVFDQDELYPMLTGFENIEMGVDFSKVSRRIRHDRAEYWAKVFCCEGFMNQKSRTLSAGQRKRIALARAMMKNPDVLLLDETFHALDPELRVQLMETVLRLQKEKQFILVFATHDDREAAALEASVLPLEDEKPAGQNLAD